jgi:uncharacterized repeat protein (TIGR01451 family)
VGTNGSILCTLPAVFTAGTSADFTVVVHVPANATGGVTNIVNAISIITSDPNSANDGSSTFTALVPSADLSLVKSGPATVNAGSPIAYAITVANAGPSDAQSVALSDSIPAGATFVSLSQSSGPTFNCTTPAVGSGGTVTCTIATLAAGATASFKLPVG